MSAAAMLMLNGCKGTGAKETETSAATEGQATETQSDAPVVTKVTYSAEDGSYSIILPDASWENTKDEADVKSFTSEGQGEITITHASGDAVSDLLLRKKEEKLMKALEQAGFAADNIQLTDFQYDKTDGIKTTTYTLVYTDTTAGTYYAVVSAKASGSEGYQAVALVKSGDETVLSSVKEAVNSFQVQKDLATDTAGTGDEQTSSNSGNEERYFFDEAGNTIYTSENADGAWVDTNGMVYYFYEKNVEDANGTTYYYDSPEYRTNNSGQNESSNTTKSDETADYYDFYDKNGKHIIARQDENGKWVGDDGKTYTFGDDGVTDSEGNFSPY